MTVVGVGAQGTLDDVDGFLAATGLQSATMLFDPDFRSWSHYEVTGQPTAILVSANGEVIEYFDGRFKAEDVLQRLNG